ncbi:MAG: MFS transporter [Acidimicrobiia bacterium]|nr:MFS transporter [Acidimicrobiia bacterium]
MTTVPAHTRRRLLGTLFLSSAFVRTGFIAAVTVAALVAEDLLGSVALSGMPAAAATIGVAVGTTPVAALMAARGRRIGIAGSLVLGVVGAAMAVVAIGVGSFPLFVLSLFVVGVGSSGDRLSRYAAADISTSDQRALAIAIVVWAGTIGSVVGPALLETVQWIAESLGMEGLAGAYMLAAAAVTLAVAVTFFFLRPDPLSFVADDPETRQTGTRRDAMRVLSDPRIQFAIIALAIGQVVMVIIMSMTPIHIRRAGDDLGTIGWIIAAHTFGMFALSPATGWVADRIGRPLVIVAGHVVLLIAALLAATASGSDTATLFIALFLLGVGWNFSFIAGSAYLSEAAPVEMRVSVEGLADTVVWTSGAAASLSSGLLFAVSGYAALCFIGAAMVALPAYMGFRNRRALVTA